MIRAQRKDHVKLCHRGASLTGIRRHPANLTGFVRRRIQFNPGIAAWFSAIT